MFGKLAFTIEYEWQYGGSQRLAAILSKYYKKPLYFIGRGRCKLPCWDVRVVNKFPEEPILFSIVVDKYNLIKPKNKKCVKFMHSAGTIEYLINNPKIYEILWVTHRKRVYTYGKKLGLKIWFIKNGYIPYDKNSLPSLSLEDKKNLICIISRVSKDKRIEELITIAKKVGYPLFICGSKDPTVNFLPLGRRMYLFLNCSEKTKEDILKKCKIVLHGSTGKLRDYFEYAILDAMLYGAVPVCLTDDTEQFKIINKRKLGASVTTITEAAIAVRNIMSDYEFFFNNVREFMKNFILSQPKILKEYTRTLHRIENRLFS